MLTYDTCSLSSIHSQKPWQWTPWLCHVLTYLLVFICWVPQIMLDPPTSPQMRPFSLKREAENMHAISHVLLSQFFLLPWESSQISTNQTQGSSNLMNSSNSTSSKAFRTPNTTCCSSSNCQNLVREIKVRQLKNELSSPKFSQVGRTPWTRFTKQKFIQLRTGLTVAWRPSNHIATPSCLRDDIISLECDSSADFDFDNPTDVISHEFIRPHFLLECAALEFYFGSFKRLFTSQY